MCLVLRFVLVFHIKKMNSLWVPTIDVTTEAERIPYNSRMITYWTYNHQMINSSSNYRICIQNHNFACTFFATFIYQSKPLEPLLCVCVKKNCNLHPRVCLYFLLCPNGFVAIYCSKQNETENRRRKQQPPNSTTKRNTISSSNFNSNRIEI